MTRTTHDRIKAIATALGTHRIQVTRIGDTLNASKGVGRMAHKANLDLEPILEHLATSPETQHQRAIAGFASGVDGVLAEPLRSHARTWTYALSAGRMMPNIEVHTFALGVEAAGEDPPWTQPLADGLILVCVIELDRGYRVLAQSQVASWEATNDRIYSAARSMLYHKTREARRAPMCEHVHHVHVGDGYDASRSLVLADVFFTDLDETSLRFSMPHKDALLYATQAHTSGDAFKALSHATQNAYQNADCPLSTSIFRLEYGRPVVVTHTNEV